VTLLSGISGLRLWRECGKTSPAARSVVFFAIIPGAGTRPGGLERSCAAARSTTTEITPAAPIATGINQTTATTSGFGWYCGLPTFFRPFFWSRHAAERRAGTLVPDAFRKCGSIRASEFGRRGEGRTTPDRSGPRARRKAWRKGASPAPGAYSSRGTARPSRPPLPAPLFLTPPQVRRCVLCTRHRLRGFA